jgi:three-Cys-motif partner protein
LEELQRATEEVNIKRASAAMPAVEIECLLVLNDSRPEVVALLRENIQPLIAAVTAGVPKLHLRVEFFNKPFEQAYPEIRNILERGGYRNVLFNLDQCGYSDVEVTTIVDVMQSFVSAEIFYTFAIKSLLAFLPKSIPEKLATQFGVSAKDLGELSGLVSNQEWLGAAERLVFDSFRSYASYVSPFSINNPEGWRYWLILFQIPTALARSTTTYCTRTAARCRLTLGARDCICSPTTLLIKGGNYICLRKRIE